MITATMINSYPIEEVIRGRLGTIKFVQGGFQILKDDPSQQAGKPARLEQTVHPAPGQLAAVLLEEEAAIVRRLIAEMPTDRDRQLLLRFYVAEEEKDSICGELGLDSLHFNRVLFRARHRFKELLVRFQERQGAASRSG